MTRAGFARIIVWAAACLLLAGCGSDESERDESVATARASLVDCEGIPEWTATSYLAGDRVQNGGAVYECKPFPFTGWCSQAAYEPGVSPFWQDAWTRIDDCDGDTPPSVPTTCDPSVEPCCPSTGFTETTLSEDANVFSSAQFGLCVRALGGSDTVMVGPAGYVIAGEGDDIVNGWGGSTVYPGAGADNVSVSSGGTVIILDASEALAGENLDGGGDGTLITPVPLEQLQAQGVVVSGFANILVTAPGQPSGATSGPLTIRGRLTDASGKLIIGARVDLQGSEQAVRFSDFSGSYAFHVGPGSYSLRASGGCLLTPSTVDLGNINTDVVQEFSASGPGCVSGTPAHVIATGQEVDLTLGTSLIGRTYVRVEQHVSNSDALAHLQQITEEQPVPSQALTIFGNPAIERETVVQVGKILLPDSMPGQRRNIALTTAVVQGPTLVRFESRLPEAADSAAVELFLAAARNFDFANVSNFHGPAPAPLPVIQHPPATPPPVSILAASTLATNWYGELEVAASDSSNAVVLGTQIGPYYSLDAGQTFQPSTWNTVPPEGTTMFANGGDPTVAVGAPDSAGNQTIYFANLAFVAPGETATDLPFVALALFQSTDNGQTFSPVGNGFPSNCFTGTPNDCRIPDQAQLVADRRTRAVAPDGQQFDQLYLAWRHFDGLTRTTVLACSSDGGNSWTFDTSTLGAFTGVDYPRMTVAPDGRLLVTYGTFFGKTLTLGLREFSSCADGFQPEPSASLVAMARNPPDLAGMPRQPVANYSIAAGENEAGDNIVYVAYVTSDTASGNDEVRVARSTDTLAWTNTTINRVPSGNRYFPSICTTGSTAFVSWYDRRAGAASGSPDLTAYFRSSLLDHGARLGREVNVTGDGFEDPQCLTGFPGGGSSTVAAELECTNLPNVPLGTGQCRLGCQPGETFPCGSLNQCDHRAGIPEIPNTCEDGETCSIPAGSITPGFPKYGDYNGSDCARGRVYLAWASGTPPERGCLLDGMACTEGTECCFGNCLAGTCAPTTTAACAGNGAACMVNSDCCSGSCQGGQCFPRVGIYSTSASTGLQVELVGNDVQLRSFPFTICGSGSGFTPGGPVGLTYVHPTLSTETQIVAVADSDGNVSFSDEEGHQVCTGEEFEQRIVTIVSDEATGESVTFDGTIPTCFVCRDVILEEGSPATTPACPGQFGGGCP